jgi:hypothetical protein
MGHKFYDVIRRSNDRGKKNVDVWGKRSEWTEEESPARERTLPGGEDEQQTVDMEG